MWLLFALSSLFASTGCILFSLLAFFNLKKTELNMSFVATALVIGIWELFPFAVSVITDHKLMLFTGRLIYMGAIFAPPVLFHFMYSAFEIYHKPFNRIIIKVAYIVSIFFLCFSFSEFFIKDISVHNPAAIVVPGKLYCAFIAYFLALVIYSLVIITKKYKSYLGYKKEQMKFILIAFILAIVAGVMHMFSAYVNLDVFPHDFFVIAWAIIVFYAITKYKFLNLKVALIKSFILIFIYCIVLGVPIYIGIITKSWFVSSIFLFGLSTSGPLIFKYLEKRAETILLAEQEKYHQFLMQASRGMVDQHDLNKLSKMIVMMIKKSVKVSFISFFIYNEKEQKYVELASRGLENKNTVEFDSDSDTINFIRTANDEPLLFFDIPERYKKRFSLLSKNIRLIVPSVLRKELVAFMVLGEKSNGSIYSEKDLGIFKTLSNQAALAIENCRFIEKSKEHQKRIFEAEKLASIGGMADGLAHQIKNRLNQFSLIGGELEMEAEDFEAKYEDLVSKDPEIRRMIKYMKEISESIISNVSKTNTVLKGILDFARTAERDTMFSYFSLKVLIEQSLQLIQVKHSKESLPIVFEIPKGDNIYGVRAQIQEVIFNCIDNAFEAITEKEACLKNSLLHEIKMKNINIEKFVPEIKIGLKYIDKTAKIYIQDNGIGIKDEDLNKIFSAFFTTKPSSKSGSGIGTYVAKRIIVENHKGSIDFKSKYGFGTTFVITLPLYKESKVSNDVKENK